MIKPKLVENNVLNNIKTSLLQCKKYRFDYYSKLLNISLFIIFFIILGITLYYSKKNKENRIQYKKINNKKVKENILEIAKITEKNINQKMKNDGYLITDLPQTSKFFK